MKQDLVLRNDTNYAATKLRFDVHRHGESYNYFGEGDDGSDLEDSSSRRRTYRNHFGAQEHHLLASRNMRIRRKKDEEHPAENASTENVNTSPRRRDFLKIHRRRSRKLSRRRKRKHPHDVKES
ncbi:hypothetical protein Leryth_005286 [Lithospermum erythrorhizon]|nr:hypothetical protein Leryth_005286 [Lithospermum erythrorhizon]